jgi:glycosyltransferase involved in cell wall biosynthesis
MKSISNMRKSFFKLKVLLVDSSSTDNTKKIFLSYGKELDLIFKDIGKCSIGEARNYAIKFSRSDYLIFLDSDDALPKDRLNFDYKLIAKYPKLNFLYGDSMQINKNSFKDSYYCKSSKISDKYQFLNIPYNLSSTTISRDFLIKKRIFFKTGKKGRLGEDWRFINDINNATKNYLYTPKLKVVINSRYDSHTQNHLKSDLNITKIDFICNTFIKIRDKKKFFRSIFFSTQIQAALILSLINIARYTKQKKIKYFFKDFKKVLSTYKRISLPFVLLNLFLLPLSIYFILFIHRRSIFSPLRSKISYDIYKSFSLFFL